MGQDHTVIPEFRISEHIDYYVDNGFTFNNKFLTIEGSKISASADSPGTGPYNEDFFKTYSHSDFMKHFAEISNDLDSAKLSRLTLKCSGVKKLLPYQGFYPVLRTVQLGALLSQSFGPFIDGSKVTQGYGSGLSPGYHEGDNGTGGSLVEAAIDDFIIQGFIGDNECLLGDFNEDALINIQDVVSMINVILGPIEDIQNYICFGDLNQDGTIDVLDVILLVNMILD